MTNLKALSNAELENKLGQLIQQEKRILHLVIRYIHEVDVRRLYLKKGYPSLFVYLMEKWGYSEGPAQTRIDAARLLKDVPDLAKKIEQGSIKLTQIGEISRAIRQKEKASKVRITSAEKQDLLQKIENHTGKETQVILCQELDLEIKQREVKRMQKDESIWLEMRASKECYQKLLRCKEIASHILIQQRRGFDTIDVIEVLADQFLKAHGENFTSDNSTAESAVESNAPASTLENNIIDLAEGINSNNKTITPRTRRLVLKHLKCCQYQSPDTQKICGNQFALEVEHRISVWAGGTNEIQNLTVLCSVHNRQKYRDEAQLRFV